MTLLAIIVAAVLILIGLGIVGYCVFTYLVDPD